MYFISTCIHTCTIGLKCVFVMSTPQHILMLIHWDFQFQFLITFLQPGDRDYEKESDIMYLYHAHLHTNY